MAENQEKKTISQLIVELIELTNAYIRQELRKTFDSSLARPAKKLGRWMGLAAVASTLFALAAIFIAVGAFQLLAELVGAAWIAYLIIGGILFLAGLATAGAMSSKGARDNGES